MLVQPTLSSRGPSRPWRLAREMAHGGERGRREGCIMVMALGLGLDWGACVASTLECGESCIPRAAMHAQSRRWPLSRKEGKQP